MQPTMTGVAGLWVGIGLIGCGATAPPADLSVRRVQVVTVYEGLPHLLYEPASFQAEKQGAKPIKDLAGYSFYGDPLAISSTEVASLIEILGDPGIYVPFAGEKKCGGFHPDYAVEWQDGNSTRTTLLCFGCFEAKILVPGSERRYDLSRSARDPLRALLSAHRKNRPEPTDKVGALVRPESLGPPSRQHRSGGSRGPSSDT